MTRIIKNNRGQNVIEMVLITVVTLIVATVIMKTIRSEQYVAKLVDGPWEIMAGMIENGVWGTPAKTKIHHPNYLRRHISFKAKKP